MTPPSAIVKSQKGTDEKQNGLAFREPVTFPADCFLLTAN